MPTATVRTIRAFRRSGYPPGAYSSGAAGRTRVASSDGHRRGQERPTCPSPRSSARTTRAASPTPASRSSASTPRHDVPERPRERLGEPGEFPFTRGAAPRDVPQAAVDDAPVRRLRVREGVQRALQVPARARLDRPLDGVRPADPARPRLRRPALPRRGRPHRRRDRHDRRHADRVRRDPARPGLDVDDDQRARRGAAAALPARRRGAGRRRRRSCAARSRTTSSRSTSRAGTSSTRPRRSMRLTTDLFAYCKASTCRSGTRSRSPATTSARRAARRSRRSPSRSPTGSPTCRPRVDAGLAVDDFAPRLAFFFNGHNNVFQEVAKFRAARRMWAEIMRERFGAQDPKSLTLRFHTQTGGVTLTAQQPENNIVRVALQALRRGLRRHAVAAHERLRRGARAADRARREDRAAHAADHRATSPAPPTPSTRSPAPTSSRR